ncbi:MULTISPECIES: hypothetical protein [Thiomicrorhabdus]|uniref:Uncharacterized protein n=1 Tax=Thiomicrorhabdus xiamenensis TaxID=2739063 RepID=A0A7D4TH89_9GAMM|nr:MULTISPECIES: hypothetical protein [Thiomicrorhabdus]MBO1923365.1 hypothetical protein [Thiomicrorhabdus sp. 6S3-12]QKI90128.1 hypothetical protein HQN79_11360 [Thiomicrorhabdus xiamenensis]
MKTLLASLFIAGSLFTVNATADSWSFDGQPVTGSNSGGCTWSFDCEKPLK